MTHVQHQIHPSIFVVCCFFSLNFAFSWPAFCSRLMTLIAPTPSSLFYLRFLLFFLVVFFFTLIISVVSFNLRTFVHIFQLFIATNWDWSVCECVFELSAFDYVATLFVGGIYVWKSFGLSLSVCVCVSASFGAGWAKDRTKNLIAFSNDAKPFFTLVFHCIIGCICVCVFFCRTLWCFPKFFEYHFTRTNANRFLR